MGGRDELARRYRCLSRAAKLQRLGSIRVAEARLAVAKTELLAQLDDPDPLGKDFDAEEVACVLRVPSSTAALLLHHSRRLVESFPQAVDAMHAGELPVRLAHKLAEHTVGLPDALLPVIEKTVLVKASRQTPGQFAKSLARAIAEVDTRSVERRHAVARTGRTIQWGPVDNDGMTDNYLRLPADEQATLRTRVEAVADGWKGLDDRYADERRADALCALAGGLNGDVRTQVSVVVSMSTLLGADDQPGRLNGQTIPAPLARALAHGEHTTWRRLVTDPIGRIRDISSTSYVPPRPMARFVQLRDERCVFPTCSQPATRCELDHTKAWADGGQTCSANLMPLCSRHHHLKHDGNWSLRRLDDGTVRWTTPTGRTYDTPPPDPLPRDTLDEPPPPF